MRMQIIHLQTLSMKAYFTFFRFLLISWLFLYSQALLSQEKLPETYQMTSPYHTIYAFLDNLQSDNFNPSLAARTLNAPQVSNQEKEKLAIKLIQFLDGNGLLVDLEALPRNPDYIDTLSNKARYVPFPNIPEIYVEKEGNIWFFSQKTVKSIEALHQKTYPYGLDQLLELVPQGANQKFLGLTTWQYLGLIILTLLTLILHKLLSFLFGGVILRLFIRLKRGEVAKKLVQPMARPMSLFILCWILSRFIPVLGLPVALNWLLLLFLEIALPIYAIMIAWRLVDFLNIYMQRRAERTEGTLDDQLTPLIRKSLKIILVIVGMVYILQNLEFNITALLTGLSIGTLAFALAAQDTIKNLFGSVTIFLDRPFQVGDWVMADGIDGSIEEVGFRSTRVRTFHNSLIYIPNGKLADMTIDNMGARSYRRFRSMLSLTYDTPPELIDAFVEGVRLIIQKHPQTRKDYYHVYLNSFSAASLDILLYTFFNVPDWGEELKARHNMMLAIIRLADHLGVRFAFPTQTIHIEDLPGQKSLTPDYSPESLRSKTLEKKVNDLVSTWYTEETLTDHLYRGKDSGLNESDA